jgi:hypothetical protein
MNVVVDAPVSAMTFEVARPKFRRQVAKSALAIDTFRSTIDGPGARIARYDLNRGLLEPSSFV